ncbi:hypothetical protein IQ07DRAFT_654142 [Pyrenochaeta sp. DS3sAY3a]|nr:hypothetical protein IQ07DRAFT_654142 [Pyrenochaeta sp. DS3sAY3a]
MSDAQSLYGILNHSLVSESASDSNEMKADSIPWQLSRYQQLQFDRAVAKGRAAHKMMHASDSEAAAMFAPPRVTSESTFQSVDDLKDWGYLGDKFPAAAQSHVWDVLAKTIGTLETASSMHYEPQHYPALYHEQVFPYNKGTEHYEPTFAYFCQVINLAAGVLTAADNLSPIEVLARSGISAAHAPELKYWSDVAYLQWLMEVTRANSSAKLNYILRYDVTNRQTDEVVDLIHFRNDTETVVWPGQVYAAHSEDGLALLGTPNSPAYLLIQHKKGLGHRAVDKITVFKHETKLMMLFHITEVPQETREQTNEVKEDYEAESQQTHEVKEGCEEDTQILD